MTARNNAFGRHNDINDGLAQSRGALTLAVTLTLIVISWDNESLAHIQCVEPSTDRGSVNKYRYVTVRHVALHYATLQSGHAQQLDLHN